MVSFINVQHNNRHTQNDKTSIDVFYQQDATVKTVLWLYCFTLVKQPFHTGGNGTSLEWKGTFSRVVQQMMQSSCMETPIPLHGYCHTYIKITYPTWKPISDEPTSARKKRKSTSWGYRKFRHRILLFISAIQWRNKKLLQRRNKNRINVTKTNYSTQFRYRKPRYGPARSGYRHHRQVEQLPPAPIYGCHRWHSLAKHRKPERFQEPTK